MKLETRQRWPSTAVALIATVDLFRCPKREGYRSRVVVLRTL
jgi:hypothetical protein